MHKTGTKALQAYLAANRLQLAQAGVHYPRAGRHRLEENLYTAGHHQIAFDLANEDRSASLADVAKEVRLVQAATVILSSEEFLPLAYRPGALEAIVAMSRDLDYEPAAVIVLRAQPDYLESIYSEIAKTSFASNFDDLIEQTVRDGHFMTPNYTFPFDLAYTTVIGRLEAIFGLGNVVARAYRRDRNLDFGHSDFLSVVAHLRGGLRLENARNPLPSTNERVTLLQLLANTVRTRGGTFDAETFVREHFPHFDEADLARPFFLMTRADRRRLLSRFAADNAAINARFGIEIPFVSEADTAMSDADETRAREHRTLLGAVLQATNYCLPAG
jgi:hypothetical protein